MPLWFLLWQYSANRCSTMKSEKSSQIRQEILILLRRNNVISWNKEMSAHGLSEICEIKLLTKHFSLPHIYFVVCKRQWTYTPCNKIADEKQNKEKKTNWVLLLRKYLYLYNILTLVSILCFSFCCQIYFRKVPSDRVVIAA